MARRRLSLAAVLIVLVAAGSAHAQERHARWSWQRPHAKVLPQGDLEWAPEPFVFESGESVRHIDFASGDDAADGLTKATAWKHHPWDPEATGRAAECEGVRTYVFKRGVVYRGELNADESGRPNDPIRLTSDPSWGEGEAVLCGSEAVGGWTRGSDHPDIPEPEKVWHVDLDWLPRNVWLVEDGGVAVRIPLARTPNWSVTDPDDVKSEWWEWENPQKPFDNFTQRADGTRLNLAIDTVHLTEPADYYRDAVLWTEYGWVMGTPYPCRVELVDSEQKGLGFGGQWGAAGGQKIVRYNRYYLEDKPHCLDSPGEFWFERKDDGGRLHIRLPDDGDPNGVRIEVAKRVHVIESVGMSHVDITGLAFRFTNVIWDLTAGPWGGRDVDPACIRLLGSGTDIRVANCTFENVHMAARMKAVGTQDVIDRVVIADNEVAYTDHGAFDIAAGWEWGMAGPDIGRLYDVRIMRNSLQQIGRRPSRYGQGHALVVSYAETLEVAGNILDRCYGSGIFVFGGKPSGAVSDRPFSRMLVHHNKVTDPMLNTNDWGGIETWQGGPAYVYDNISGNPGGYWNYGHKLNPTKPVNARFGHAYYMDGAFKNHYFNNIAWGKSKDPLSPLGNTSAFQEIHSYQNSVFNNTIYNFVIGSRRQAAHAGRNKFLGNVWQGIGYWVFRHADPAKTLADGNAADAGEQKEHFALETNAFAENVFFDLSDKFGVLEPSGRWHEGLASYQKVLADAGALASGMGEVVSTEPLPRAAQHDFRPATASPAVDAGVRAFVPWGLHGTVAEWSFYTPANDPDAIIDEHWYMTPYHVKRDDYYERPTYPLRAVNVQADDYVAGPLEDWTRGALSLNGRDQYAVLPNAEVTQPFQYPVTYNAPNWGTMTVPAGITPGQRVSVEVRLAGVEPPMKVKVDLHWGKSDGQFGGFNAWGGDAQDVTGEGPYVFHINPQEKEDLGGFVVTVFLSPTGEWADRVRTAQADVAKGNAEGKTQNVPMGGGRVTETKAVSGPDLKSPQVHTSSFLVEAYFRTAPGHAGGVLVEKMSGAGYSLAINEEGGVTFSVSDGGPAVSLPSRSVVNDGEWHHVIAEADRTARTLTLYVDGRPDASGSGPGVDASLANDADLHVGGTPTGRCLEGAIEFMRIALGTLADSKTTIEELYAWQFDGPFLRDFCGNDPVGRRDAGAIEAQP